MDLPISMFPKAYQYFNYKRKECNVLPVNKEAKKPFSARKSDSNWFVIFKLINIPHSYVTFLFTFDFFEHPVIMK
jgi:hypothetical protein